MNEKLYNPFRKDKACQALLFPIVFLLSTYFSHAQLLPEVSPFLVKLDSFKVADKPIPFDRNFSMMIATREPQNVVRVFAYPTSFNKAKEPVVIAGTMSFLDVTPRVVAGQLEVNFTALSPSFNFDFSLVRKFDGKRLDKLLGFVNFMAYNSRTPWSTRDVDDMENKFHVFSDEVSVVPKGYVVIKSLLYDYLFERDCLRDPKSPGGCHARSLEKVLSRDVTDAYTHLFDIDNSVSAYAGSDSIYIADLSHTYQQVNAKRLSAVQLLKLLRIAEALRMDDMMKGIINMNYDYHSKSANIYDLKERFDNLDTNYKQMSALLDVVEALKFETGPADTRVNNIYAYLKSCVAELNVNRQTAETSYTVIRNYVQSFPGVVYAEWFGNNTTNFRDMESKSGSLFSAQIGISAFQVSRHKQGLGLLPKLTAGVNINFRSIDKNLERRRIPHKGFAHYISGYVGVTFGKFRDDEFDNFLPSNSLLVGLNYRITKVLYFSAGGSAFRQRNRNPIVNSHHVQLGAYAALLLDLDIAKAATSVTSVLFK